MEEQEGRQGRCQAVNEAAALEDSEDAAVAAAAAAMVAAAAAKPAVSDAELVQNRKFHRHSFLRFYKNGAPLGGAPEQRAAGLGVNPALQHANALRLRNVQDLVASFVGQTPPDARKLLRAQHDEIAELRAQLAVKDQLLREVADCLRNTPPQQHHQQQQQPTTQGAPAQSQPQTQEHEKPAPRAEEEKARCCSRCARLWRPGTSSRSLQQYELLWPRCAHCE